jgi:hypothetical protein
LSNSPLAAAVLRANWWTDGGNIHYSVDGSGLLLYFRAGPESSFLGNEAGHFRVSYARSSKSVHCDCNLWRLVANLDQKYEAVLEKAMRIEGRSKLKFGILLVAALLVTPALAQMGPGGQGPAELQQKLAVLKQSAAKNKQQLHRYQWVETTQLTLKGQPKPAKSDLCSYGPNGLIQKVPIGEQQPQQQQQSGRRGKLKERVVEKKTDEMEDYMQQVKSIISLYVPPDPQRMEKAFQAHNVSMNSTLGAGAAQLVFKNYAQPGDQMTIAFDPAAKKVQTVNVNTYLGDPKDAITLAVRFATLPDGTNYAAQTVLNAPSKEIQVTTTNANYSKLAQ